jgi:putative NIF3 family GTP cyclohydrolase 1 type 2
VKAQDLVEHYQRLGSTRYPEDGLLYGDPAAEVRGVQVCWMASIDAIEHAAAAGLNVIIAHEDPFYPMWGQRQNRRPDEFPPDWRVNERRVGPLARHGIAVIRAHRGLDEYCVLDAFAEKLGLGVPLVDEGPYPYRKIYQLPAGTTFGSLIERVKEIMGLPHLRVTPHDPATLVHRAGLPWGGLGLDSNVGYMQRLLEHAPDVFIAGESDNYGMHFAWESGVPMIETSHELSENPGLERFAAELRATFPGIPVAYYANPMPWRWA